MRWKELRPKDSQRIIGNFDSGWRRDYNESVDFLAQHFLPIFKYLFFIGLIGAVPVIIVTAIKTAQSMLEEDETARDNKA